MNECDLHALLCNTNKLLAAVIAAVRHRGTGLMLGGNCDEVLRKTFATNEHRVSSWITPFPLAASEIMKEDPQRIGFIFANASGQNISINIDPAVSMTYGIRVDGSERVFQLWQPLAGTLVNHRWLAIGGDIASQGVLFEHFCGKAGRPGDGVTVGVCP
jgi:hypothetical protein